MIIARKEFIRICNFQNQSLLFRNQRWQIHRIRISAHQIQNFPTGIVVKVHWEKHLVKRAVDRMKRILRRCRIKEFRSDQRHTDRHGILKRVYDNRIGDIRCKKKQDKFGIAAQSDRKRRGEFQFRFGGIALRVNQREVRSFKRDLDNVYPVEMPYVARNPFRANFSMYGLRWSFIFFLAGLRRPPSRYRILRSRPQSNRVSQFHSALSDIRSRENFC
jgi:hypothetical protein